MLLDLIELAILALPVLAMASGFKLATTARNAAVDGVVDLIDAGTTNATGKVEVRTGSPPTDPQTAAGGTLLGTLLFSNPAFGAAASGTATANAITSDTSADATGTAGWFRVYDRDDAAVFDGTAGEAADTPDMVFDDKNIVIGGTIACTSWTVTQPEGP